MSTSFTTSLRFSVTPNKCYFRVAQEAPLNGSIELLGNIVNPEYQPPIQVIPGDTPLPDETATPPFKDNNDGSVFNHLLLGRVTNQPSRVFNLSVYGLDVLVKGLDLSPSIYALDWSTPISGISQGSLSFIQTVGTVLDPDLNGITQGDEVEIYVKTTESNRELVARCFVIGNPKYDLNGKGEYELSLEIGDELSLLSNTIRNRSKYCGIIPSNTQGLAQIYANVNGLRTRVFPVGHEILEASTNNFLTESPFEFLSAIYAPVNRDVRTNPTGSIIFPFRPSFNANTARVISYRDVIESQNSFSQFYEPYTRVKASNDFTISLPFEFSRRSKTVINGNPENTKPWFQGGYTETTTTITSYGDTDIYTLEETFGYVPIESLPWPKELVDEDPCAVGGFTTIWGVISNRIVSLSYIDHISGNKIVTKEETWVNGLEPYQIKDEGDPNFEDYQLFNGLKEYSLTVYNWTPQVNLSVCEKDYNLAIVNQRVENYTLNDLRELTFSSWEQSAYSPSGSSSLLGQTSFTGVEQTWVEVRDRGEFSTEENLWVIQPSEINPGVNPPNARIIKRATQDITNFSEFSLLGGNLEPTPINAPFCYSKSQLDTVSNRYLRENYGLSKAKVITVPWHFVLELGESIIFQDRDGTDKNYIVWTKEINATENQVTKTYTLSRAL